MTQLICEQCGAPQDPRALACPNCGSLIYRRRLEQLSGDAMRLEALNPAAAAMVWRQCLDLLPPDSAQYAQIYQHLGALTYAQSNPPPGYPSRRIVPPRDDWWTAIAKTLGSMLVSILVYYLMLMHSMTLAIAFVLLMLIHEMGHVLAMRYYGLSASPPIFIPFIGALINLRQQPPNAKVEAVVGIGGPFLGTIGALACYALGRSIHGPMGRELLWAADLGFFLNLFNLLPVPPLDGGRITAAISPWLWIVGLVGLVALLLRDLGSAGGGFGVMILLLILFYALPRIRATLQGRDRFSRYYAISRTVAWAMGAAYFGLGIILGGMLLYTGGLSNFF